MMFRALALLLCLQGGTALRLSPALTQQCKTALVAGVCSAQLLVAPAFGVVGPSLSEAITELDASAYPIIKALPADTFPAFSEKIANLFLGFKPDKLAKSIDLGADLFNSVPQGDMCAWLGLGLGCRRRTCALGLGLGLGCRRATCARAP